MIGHRRDSDLPAARVAASASRRRPTLWEADRVVLAAGSWSSMITVEVRIRSPVKPIRGQLIQLQTDPGAIHSRHLGTRTATSCRGRTVRCWSDPPLKTLASMRSTPPKRSQKLRAAGGVAGAERWRRAEMSSVRTGLRPKGPDDLPILGRSQAVPGLIYATAHYRNGVMFTPLTIQLVSDLVFDRARRPGTARSRSSARWPPLKSARSARSVA